MRASYSHEVAGQDIVSLTFSPSHADAHVDSTHTAYSLSSAWGSCIPPLTGPLFCLFSSSPSLTKQYDELLHFNYCANGTLSQLDQRKG